MPIRQPNGIWMPSFSPPSISVVAPSSLMLLSEIWKVTVPPSPPWSVREMVNRSMCKLSRKFAFAQTFSIVSSMAGADPATGKVPDDPASQVDLALNRVDAVVKAAGLELKNMVFVNPYLTTDVPARVMNERYARRFEFGNTPARATIEVSSLPGGAHIEYTGVAVRDLARRKAVRPKNMPPSPTASPCVFAGDTLYCSAKDGFIPGPHGGVYATSTQHQLRQTMRNQLDNLEEADMKFDQVVATTVYLDNLSDVSVFDEVYAQYFGSVPPARTTVQQIPPTERKADKDDHFPGLEQVSLIAVRNRGSR